MDGKTLEYIRRNKMAGLSKFEQNAYLELIEKLGLDLLTDEVMFLKGKPYITRDGLLHIARNFQDLESIQYITIYKGYQGEQSKLFSFDLFKMVDMADNSYGIDISQLLPQPEAYDEIEPYAVICRVKRANKGWYEGIAWLEDYIHRINGKKNSAWKTSAYTMLTIRALTKALKVAYMVGMTSVEEIAEIQATQMDIETSKGSDVERLKLLSEITDYIKAISKNKDEETSNKTAFTNILGKKVRDASYNELQSAFEKFKKSIEGGNDGENK